MQWTLLSGNVLFKVSIWCPVHLTMGALGRSTDRQERGGQAIFSLTGDTCLHHISIKIGDGKYFRWNPLNCFNTFEPSI